MSVSISVIIPAYNAADTIAQTLNSLRAQLHTDWEAIVVDDGSTDDTFLIAQTFATKDGRVRVAQQQKLGSSAARNKGIDLSANSWLLFLDADDCIMPQHMHHMCAVLDINHTLDAVVCGWRYLMPDGTFTEDVFAAVKEDMFPQMVRTCAFIIHACIVRKSLVSDVGGFDASLSVCVDWDMWQRVARSGAKFGALKEAHAIYRMRANSVSRNKEIFFNTALHVLQQGYMADKRVPHTIAKYKNGLPCNNLHEQEIYWACWCAGLFICDNADATHLLQSLNFSGQPTLDATWVAENIFDAVCRYTCQHPYAVYKIWPQFKDRLHQFLKALEEAINSIGFAKSCVAALTKKVIQPAQIKEPFVIETTQVMRLEITHAITDIHLPSTIERIYCVLEMEGIKLGTIQLPVFDNYVAATVLKDAVVAKYSWDVLLKYFENAQAKNKNETTGNTSEIEDTWQHFLQLLWNRPQWPVAAFYNPVYKEVAHLERHTKDKMIAVDICVDLVDIITNLPTVDVLFFVAGIPLLCIPFEASENIIPAQSLRAAITTKSAFELCRICVREALVGQPLHASFSFRERLQQAKKINNAFIHFNKEGYTEIKAVKVFSSPVFLLGRYTGPVGSSVYRRASLPSQLYNEINELVRQSDNQTLKESGKLSAIQYMPELLRIKNGDNKTSQTTANKVFQNAISETLPVLKFPTVVPVAQITNGQSQLSTDDFEKQLKYLQENNYHSASWDDWLHAIVMRQPLQGKAIICTFNDNATSFYHHVWPLLKQYGFGATFFVHTNGLEEKSSSNNLMLSQIQAMQKEGVTIGLRYAEAMSLNTLSPLEVARFLVTSKTMLQKVLGTPVTVIDYGSGPADEVTTHLAGACGFLMGLNNNQGYSSLQNDPLQLPTIQVSATNTFDQFIALLTH